MDDADFEKAIHHVLVGCFLNSGQFCAAGTRVFVQEGIYDAFVAVLAQEAQKLVVDHGFAEGMFIGPVISQAQMDKILNLIAVGKKEGARLVSGGNRVDRPGFFIEPTIFADVTDDMTIAREEIFGPVMSVFKFKTVDEVIERGNGSDMGLACGIQTTNLNTALKISENMLAGQVYVNEYPNIKQYYPFGGHKMSGLGRELGDDHL
jgi:aldehyde dehydrogenase (NAD+)